MINYVQKNYKNSQDVAKSLKQMENVDCQTKDSNIKSRQTRAKKLEQAGFNIKYQEEVQRHMDQKDSLDEGLSKAYALIFNNYCTKPMQARIEQHPKFETRIEDNPIELLETIKTLMHDTVRAIYLVASITEAHARLSM